MATLKEIKGRISSVGSTLKITSAMKMVASAKLRRAQQAIGNMLLYEKCLQDILVNLISSGASVKGENVQTLMSCREARHVAIVAFSSNSSLCGAFNSNIIKETSAVINEYLEVGLSKSDITVFSVGKKMSDAMRKQGFDSPEDFTQMSARPGYESASSLAETLLEGFLSGRFDKVELVYNHYKSNASQPSVRKTYLPMSLDNVQQDNSDFGAADEQPFQKFIIEPDPTALMETLLPLVVRLEIYTVLLDSNAAEHAARTVAMQTATDNGEALLQELTLEYNKSRQNKITSEILDIVSGASA